MTDDHSDACKIKSSKTWDHSDSTNENQAQKHMLYSYLLRFIWVGYFDIIDIYIYIFILYLHSIYPRMNV